MHKILFYAEKAIQVSSFLLLASMLTACCLWSKGKPRHPIEKIILSVPPAKEVTQSGEEGVKPHWLSWAGKGPRLVGEESPEPE